MPGFNFKLERVLQVKKYKEDELKTQLANLKREYLQEEAILWTLEENLQEQFMLLIEKQKTLTNVIAQIQWSYNYIIKLYQDIETQKKKLEGLSEKIKELTQKLIGASQEKQVLENLKQRKFIQFKREIEKQEQEFLDEVGITRYKSYKSCKSYII
ncbi:MAG: flagellar export protein FliJ [bacterium]|nr:flagellar export protein FliJ [bacterium]